MHFSDRLQASIDRSKSFIVAGIDPVLETLPTEILKQADTKSSSNDELIYNAITSFYSLGIGALHDSIAAVKPNAAFFEQYGIAGLKALGSVIALAREHNLPVILDAKRGDIGSTAGAYSRAYLARTTYNNSTVSTLEVDAITVNPYLGFDTLEPFLKDCAEFEKGIFVLVKTSNPGSQDLMSAKIDRETVAERVARWVDKTGSGYVGMCGYSSIGCVVGATYPEEARSLRSLMPKALFLIPGMGAQGGTAKDAVTGFSAQKGGAIINLSRGLFSSFTSNDLSLAALRTELQSKVAEFNRDIFESLQ